MMAAPICTVGPSRPIEAPHARPSSVSATLPAAMRRDSTRATAFWSVMCSAAMVCGMPLPCAPGNTRRVSRNATTMPAGQMMKAIHGRGAWAWTNRSLAASAAQAKPMATSATITAPIQNTRRRSHSRGDSSGIRRRRRSAAGGAATDTLSRS